MKKLLLSIIMFVAVVVSVHAQPGFTPRTVEERVVAVHAKLDSAFKLEASKIAEADSAFAAYYRESDKIRQDMMAGGERPTRDAMMEKMKPVTEARDEKLKKILTEAQFKAWKEEIEPGMRPQRGPGGGGRN